MDSSNNILDLNVLENIFINNTNATNNENALLNLNNIDLPLERTVPIIVRQNAFEKS